MMAKLWGFARPYRLLLLAALVAMVFGAGLSVTQPYLIKQAIDHHILRGDLSGTRRIAWLFLLAVIGEYAVKGVYTYGLQSIAQKVLGALRQSVYNRILEFPMAYFDRTPTGVLLARTVSDAESLGETLAAGVVSILLDVLTIASTLAMMIVLSWTLSLGVLGFAPLLWVLIRWFGYRLKQSFSVVRHFNAELSGFLDESLAGMSILQIFRKTAERRQGFNGLSRAYCQATVKSNVYDASLYAIMEGMLALALGILLLAMASPGLRVVYSAGLLVAFMEYLQRIFSPIKEFSAKIAMIQRASVDLGRLMTILESPDRIGDGSGALAHIREGVRFDHVRFRYRETAPWVLNDMSMSVHPGETVAVVGTTGSGKSTLIKLLLRHYDTYQGHITVDGRDVRTLKRRDLYRTIALVAQDIFLFDGTIYDNIALGRPGIDLNRVEHACRIVGAATFIERYSDGYFHQIRERGGNLSAGEAQLLAFARAMAGDSEMIILDEATANIDSETEHAIEEAIAHILALKTTIVIAHRLSTLKRVGRILVLKDGRIVESGTHADLLVRQGEYFRLYQAQMLEAPIY